MPHMSRRLFTIAVAATASMAVTVPTAQAANEYGADVDYALVFPVVGANRYGDHFWASRASGTHHAVDIMADKMIPVVAVADGTISYVNSRCCTLRINHDDGWSSVYIHLNNDTPGTDDGQGWGIAPGISAGTHVSAGQIIGWVGDSGNAENAGSHLHFELLDADGVYVDPYLALRAADTGQAVAVCKRPDVSSVSTLIDGTEPLRVGARGTAITQLQQFLSAIGHDVGSADGVFGSKTLAAIRQLQERHGLNPDGVIGSETRSAISRLAAVLPSAAVLDNSGRVLRPGARGTDVSQLQQVLALAGHDPGGSDGILGPDTQAAIEAFQSQAGLDVDGKIGPNTRAQLSAALGLSGLELCS